MRLPLALTIALVLVTPVALADVDQSVGPASVTTSNYDSGDPCGGANGYHQRTADAAVEIYPGETVGAHFESSCSDQTFPGFTNHGNSTYLFVGHRVDGNTGPAVVVGYSDSRMSFGPSFTQRNCGLYIGVVAIGTNWGCLPLGQQIPLAPSLP